MMTCGSRRSEVRARNHNENHKALEWLCVCLCMGVVVCVFNPLEWLCVCLCIGVVVCVFMYWSGCVCV